MAGHIPQGKEAALSQPSLSTSSIQAINTPLCLQVAANMESLSKTDMSS